MTTILKVLSSYLILPRKVLWCSHFAEVNSTALVGCPGRMAQAYNK